MKKISFNDYIPEELADNESCRLITTEQYHEYRLLRKKLDIALNALQTILDDGDDYWDKDKAQEALTKIKEVK